MTISTEIFDSVSVLDVNGSFSDMIKEVNILRKATGSDISLVYPVKDGIVFVKLTTSKPQDEPIEITVT